MDGQLSTDQWLGENVLVYKYLQIEHPSTRVAQKLMPHIIFLIPE
jgi:hypothetical protein